MKEYTNAVICGKSVTKRGLAVGWGRTPESMELNFKVIIIIIIIQYNDQNFDHLKLCLVKS